MINPFCFIGAHNWEYRKEKHKVEGHPQNREYIRVVVRECVWCGHREHHPLPRVERKFTNWKPFDDIQKDDTINFERL
jgi:hypothetical protein